MLKYSLLVLILAIQGQGEECPLGKYGKNCDETCSANCAPSSTDESVYCDKLTGRCSEGCKSGWHGDRCNHQCSKNCLNNVCNVQNGACSKCKEHFSGDYCETAIQGQGEECPQGKYGASCDETCSANCAPSPDKSVHCHKLTGKCSEGCNRGWHGDRCKQPCSKNCLNNVCNVQNGACSKCKEHFSGDDCETGTTPPPNLAAILTPVILILAVIAVLAAIGVIVYKRKSKKPQKHVDTEGHEGEPLNPPPEETSILATVHSAPEGQEGDSPDPPRGDPDTSAQENVETELQEQDSLHPHQVELDTQVIPTLRSAEETWITRFVRDGRVDIMRRDWPDRPPEIMLVWIKQFEQDDDVTLTESFRKLLNHIVEAVLNVGDIITVKAVLLNDSVDINIRLKRGRTPLMVVARHGHKKVFDLLVSKRVDVSLVDDDGNNILHLACQGGHVDIVKSILSKDMQNINSKGQYGRSAVMEAAWRGDKDLFDVLVRGGADLSLVDDLGNTILHLACIGKNEEIVQDIISRNIVDINTRGQHGRTSVMEATYWGMRNIDFLVSNGADLSIVDNSGNTILHVACSGGLLDMVKYVLSKKIEFINEISDGGKTPVIEAAFRGNLEMFRHLVESGGNPRVTDADGNTGLHVASKRGHLDIVKYNLSEQFVNIDDGGCGKRTPIMMAAEKGHTEVLKHLVSEKADLGLQDEGGNNILHIACMWGHLEIVKYVLSLNVIDIHVLNKRDQTAKEAAKRWGRSSVYDLF
ncbi:uncharacterized protein LOC124122611 isoform X1 [Haliotis rufescens]|uniref:uncharacterized protein LOC124122611 isoform X1 n=1 Tax=Haliotis rufescens TaxID=6454 RepID=UPI00201EB7C5|nr:uncharacterized protein LOC124122611 isoform X1 [Haliotis rufescens]